MAKGFPSRMGKKFLNNMYRSKEQMYVEKTNLTIKSQHKPKWSQSKPLITDVSIVINGPIWQIAKWCTTRCSWCSRLASNGNASASSYGWTTTYWSTSTHETRSIPINWSVTIRSTSKFARRTTTARRYASRNVCTRSPRRSSRQSPNAKSWP